MNILLVGAGELGSRYLQGLVACKYSLEVTVVDCSHEALLAAKLRWIQAGGEDSKHSIRWLQSVPADLKRADVALIATSAKGRARLVNEIVKATDVRYWVLEKVLAQSSEELEEIQSALNKCEGAWVNTSMRMMQWHRSLKAAFASSTIDEVVYLGGLWGLACNAVHYLDLVSWWTGEGLNSIDVSGLDQNWHQSKREGYLEITGELKAHFRGGTSVRLSSIVGVHPQPFKVVLSNGVVWEVDEIAGTALSSTGERIDGCLEFQSQMSGRLMESIIQRGDCLLPRLDESIPIHAIFLDALVRHWNRTNNDCADRVPIT